MKQVQAFVGHSFREDDSDVVRSFLDYFNNLSHLLDQRFIWCHAESAEPRDLREKVLQKIDSSNAFIGICTRAEKVAGTANLKLPLIRPNRFLQQNLCGKHLIGSFKKSDSR